MKNSYNRCVIYTLVHLYCCDVCKIKYTPSNNFISIINQQRQKMQLVCIQIKFQINVQLQIKVSKYYVSTYLQKFTYKYNNICHKIIYTTFSYLYTKQCNNTFIHIFMSLENTFVTVILSRYILYTQNKKEIFTCAIIYLPNSWFTKSKLMFPLSKIIKQGENQDGIEEKVLLLLVISVLLSYVHGIFFVTGLQKITTQFLQAPMIGQVFKVLSENHLVYFIIIITKIMATTSKGLRVPVLILRFTIPILIHLIPHLTKNCNRKGNHLRLVLLSINFTKIFVKMIFTKNQVMEVEEIKLRRIPIVLESIEVVLHY